MHALLATIPSRKQRAQVLNALSAQQVSSAHAQRPLVLPELIVMETRQSLLVQLAVSALKELQLLLQMIAPRVIFALKVLQLRFHAHQAISAMVQEILTLPRPIALKVRIVLEAQSILLNNNVLPAITAL